MYSNTVCCYSRNTRVRTLYVKHEARGVVRAGQHGRIDAGKSNPRASASRQAAWLGRRGGLQRCRHLRRQGTKWTAWPRFHAQGRPEIWSKMVSGGEEVLAGKWGGLFLGYLLGKNIRGVVVLISFRLM